MNLQETKARFEYTQTFYGTTHVRGEEDIDFALAGNQWDDADKKTRHDAGRPCLDENRLDTFVNQVVNSAREIRPAIRVSPVDDNADVETAKVLKGMIKNIERQSKADIAYDTAMLYSVSAGLGWIRVNTRYTDPLSFDQEAVIEPVPDWKSCMIDPNSTMPDGSDAEDGFIYTDMDRKEFEAAYPKAAPISADVGESWLAGEKIRIAEHFYKKYEPETIYQCFLINGTVKVLTKPQYTAAKESVVKVLQERETRIHKVKWCKFTGAEVLEETEWLGQYIPLVPVYGKQYWHKGRLETFSLITHAKNPQRRLNYWISASTEIIALQPKTPFIGVVGQFNTRKLQWQNANRDSLPYLEYDMVVNEDGVVAPPPTRAEPIMGSPAIFQEIQSASQGINSTLGMYEENRGDESNAISGIAIRSRQIRGDKATYHFIDNLAASIRHVGVILVDLISKLYTTAQIVRILGEDGKEKNVPVNQPFVKDDNGIRPTREGEEGQGIYKLGTGKYDVDVDVGPSYANKQQEFVDIMKDLLPSQPELAAVAGDILIKAVGGPYADELVTRIRSTMPPEMLADDPMARKLEQVSGQLKQVEDMNITLMAQLEDKKKNETFENSIKEGQLKDKQANTQIKLMDTLSKIEQNGGGNEQIDILAKAIFELHTQLQGQNDLIQGFLSQGAQAYGQPANGAFPATMA